jgi:hypothetical protein
MANPPAAVREPPIPLRLDGLDRRERKCLSEHAEGEPHLVVVHRYSKASEGNEGEDKQRGAECHHRVEYGTK